MTPMGRQHQEWRRFQPGSPADRDAMDRGSGTMLTGAAILAGCVMAGLALVIIGFAVHVQQLRQAADLVAISAAEQGCSAGEKVASANNVDLAECSSHGDVFDYVVAVEVRSKFQLFGFRLPLAEVAYAGQLAR
jgi:secretion/DNA translocation related TadE-like protein